MKQIPALGPALALIKGMNASIKTAIVSTVFAMITWVPNFAGAALRGPASVGVPVALGRDAIADDQKAAKPKTFAVFVASSTDQGQAVGGVAGTAFFTSATEAVTAYHVLQQKSFEVPTGFSHRQVWLVHEEHRAIEIDAADVRFDSANDLTRIRLKKAVPSKFVYQSSSSRENGRRVSTDGFKANSAGPVFAPSARGLEIISVPRLERVHLQGELVSQTKIDLRAPDVTLVKTPCLQVTYPPIRGISGGPLLVDGQVVGVNSFGDPRAESRTWAVDLERVGG